MKTLKQKPASNKQVHRVIQEIHDIPTVLRRMELSGIIDLVDEGKRQEEDNMVVAFPIAREGGTDVYLLRYENRDILGLSVYLIDGEGINSPVVAKALRIINNTYSPTANGGV